MLREFAEKHMKSSEIKIDTELNEELWKRGITKPPRRITVKMEKDEDGVVTISLPKRSKATPEQAEEKAAEEPEDIKVAETTASPQLATTAEKQLSTPKTESAQPQSKPA